jgi:uncharacterized protein with FMN-binding domain
MSEETFMTKNNSQQTFNLSRSIKKFFLSGFVVFSFIAYAIQQRFAKPEMALNLAPTDAASANQQNLSSPSGIPTVPAQPTLAAQSAPTIQPSATPAKLGLYKDGTYTGPTIDAYYGLVEVQATVQNGKLADVKFLQYPNDRRTSVEINTQVMPWLQQEAIQAQSANVNIISGATFTSEGFAMSLDAALKSAKN